MTLPKSRFASRTPFGNTFLPGLSKDGNLAQRLLSSFQYLLQWISLPGSACLCRGQCQGHSRWHPADGLLSVVLQHWQPAAVRCGWANAAPDGSPNYLVTYGTNSLQFWRFTPNFTRTSSSTFAGPTNLGVPAFSRACSGGTCIPQPGTTQTLDSLADRLMYRNAYVHRLNPETESLLLNHSVTPGNGAASGIRWYEIADPEVT